MSGSKRSQFWVSANGGKWNSWMGGATTSPCQVLPFVSSGNRCRRWRGGYPAHIRRGVGTDGGVRTSCQSWLSEGERGEGLAVLTSLRISYLQSWILLFFLIFFFFLPCFSTGGRRSLGLDLATNRAEWKKTSVGLCGKCHKMYLQ